MPPKSGKMSREEELLLEGFSKNDSTKSSALFYGNAFIVSAIPVWLYWRIHSIDITSYAVIFAIGTLVSTWLLAFAYKNTKHLLKHKVAVKRESAVTKEMNKKLADDKKISKKEKDERILWKKNEVSEFATVKQQKIWELNFISQKVAEYESTTFSIFYNNALFLALVIIASFYILSVSVPVAAVLIIIDGYICPICLSKYFNASALSAQPSPAGPN